MESEKKTSLLEENKYPRNFQSNVEILGLSESFQNKRNILKYRNFSQLSCIAFLAARFFPVRNDR
jgi:hypothetical protein